MTDPTPVRLCMIDGTIKSGKSLSLVGHISDRLSAGSVRAEPQNGYETERVRSIVPRLGSRAMENLVT